MNTIYISYDKEGRLDNVQAMDDHVQNIVDIPVSQIVRNDAEGFTTLTIPNACVEIAQEGVG